MKRLILYLILVPIVGTVAIMTYGTILTGWTPLDLITARLGHFVSVAYVQWLMPALIIAHVDRFIPLRGWARFGTISAVGYLALWVWMGLLYGFGLGWGGFLVPLTGAITAVICCWFSDMKWSGAV